MSEFELSLDDISFNLDKSWAEIVEEELSGENVNEASPLENSVQRRSRKANFPKKVISQPKYSRILENNKSNRSSSRQRNSRKSPPKKTKEKNMIRMEKFDDNRMEMKMETRAQKRRQNWSPDRGETTAKRSSPIKMKTPNKSVDRPKRSAHPPSRYPFREHWEEPRLGWLTNEKELARRNKELTKAKEKSVYERYRRETPTRLREKNVHPITPNKYLNYTRRSWDTLVKRWKRSLYIWAGEEPSSSTNTSFCESDVPECDTDNEREKDENNSILASIQVADKPHQENDVASLLGHFDIDSQKGDKKDDEDTLKATNNNEKKPTGALDFSQLNK